MTILRVSELAERTGVPVSTLRYYERIGLVAPLGRSDNGYRVYEDAARERLAFIGRAKRLGMSLDDVATLVEAWFAGECEPLQDRLRVFVTGRIGGLRHRIADDSAFERELERILVRLGERGATPGRCGPDCGCDTDPLEAADGDSGRAAPTCSLAEGDIQRRVARWQQAVRQTTRRVRTIGSLHLFFDPSAELIVELAQLCAAETDCCPFVSFHLEITSGATVLRIRGPAGAEGLIDRIFDLRERAPSRAATPAAKVAVHSDGPRGAGGFIPADAPADAHPEPAEPGRPERTLIR